MAIYIVDYYLKFHYGMKDNYKAWGVDYKDFYILKARNDKLEFLLRFAVLAPSSHNSQPWRFEVRDNLILVSPERARALPESDKNNRQLYISLGAAIENIITAADFYNLKYNLRYFPGEFPNAAAVILFEDFGADSFLLPKDHGDMLAMTSRHTNRNKYTNEELPASFVKRLCAMSNDDLRVDILSAGKVKDRIAEIVSDALIEAMDDKNFRRELSGYVKSNITSSKIGMPMFGFGMPTPVSFFASLILHMFNVNRLSRKNDDALLNEHTPHFAIISSRSDDPESWMMAGRLFQSMALLAERKNVKTAPMAAAIQIGDHYRKIMDALHTDFRPQFFFRMGYCDDAMPHSPRLLAEDVITISS